MSNHAAIATVEAMIAEAEAREVPERSGPKDWGPGGAALGINIRRAILCEVKDRLEGKPAAPPLTEDEANRILFRSLGAREIPYGEEY